MKLARQQIPTMYRYETACWHLNQLAVGIDEVGRGCLAGPVVIAALALHPGKTSAEIKDSKLLSDKELGHAAQWLADNSWYSVVSIPASTIDARNIYQATLMGMKRAFWQLHAQLPQAPSCLLVDAMPLVVTHDNPLDIHTMTKGESHSISIAGASIMAKVYRDALMQQMENYLPGYAFGVHKGYGTPKHLELLKARGSSLIHRHSFTNNAHEDQQQTLW